MLRAAIVDNDAGGSELHHEPGGSLDQAQASEQQLTAELSSGVSITSLSQNPVARARMCCC
jgi:hypothetical protein